MTELSRANTDTDGAVQYWGQLYKHSGIGPTPKLTSLLRGLATSISKTFGDTDSEDLMPVQLIRFYESVNGDYSHLFGLSPKSLAFIYQKLCCRYSLQPDPSSDDFVIPTVPALKPSEGGFPKFFFVQLMLDPSEHWLFLQNALKKYDVKEPITGQLFPKLLPRQLFPREPLPEMVGWHQSVSKELLYEAQGHGASNDKDGDAEDSFSKLKQQAARYFSNPHSGSQDGRPAIVRHLSKGAAKAYSFVRDVVDPNLFGGTPRRSSVQDKGQSHDLATSEEFRRHNSARHSPRHEERKSRREETVDESAESEAEYQARKTRRSARRHRSHEPLMSPRMYPQEHVSAQRQPHRHRSKYAQEDLQSQGFEPTQSPPLAAAANRVQYNHVRPRTETKGYFDLPQPLTASPGRFAQSPSPLGVSAQSNSPYTPPIMAAHPLPPPPPPPAEATYGHAVGRPEARRQSTPVTGVHGRKYPTDGVPWRKK
jgi:hypothetical protein